ncbi:MAG TPA: hypothetical protein VJV79_00300 [Polyangiaceae bacterium]|nr:hypothetical protein [Polyangiaceae bacterium]
MSSRMHSVLSISLAAASVLGTLSAAYGLVYPARSYGGKPLVLVAVVGGALLTCGALWLALFAQRRASKDSERFFARLALCLSGFLLFVVVLGFGIPCLLLGAND